MATGSLQSRRVNSILTKRRRHEPPTGWNWLCRWARSQGLDPELVPLSAVTEALLAALERSNEEEARLSPAMVRLADLLVIIQAKLLVFDLDTTWENALPLVEQAYARDRAQKLISMRENRIVMRSEPTILKPTKRRVQPVDESPTVIVDLVEMFQHVLDRSTALRRSGPVE